MIWEKIKKKGEKERRRKNFISIVLNILFISFQNFFTNFTYKICIIQRYNYTASHLSE